MSKNFLVFYLLILIFPIPLGASENVEAEKMKPGVVLISAKVKGNKSIGSGFIINIDKNVADIVTASHVVEWSPEIGVAFFHKPFKYLPAKVKKMQGFDPNGLAVLTVEGVDPSKVRALNFAKSVLLSKGEEIKTIGFPEMEGIPWGVASGKIIGPGPDGESIVFSGSSVAQVYSGGPLIKDGVIVGVVTNKAEAHNYARPVDNIKKVLKKWNISFSEDKDLSVAISEKPLDDSTSSSTWKPTVAVAGGVIAIGGLAALSTGGGSKGGAEPTSLPEGSWRYAIYDNDIDMNAAEGTITFNLETETSGTFNQSDEIENVTYQGSYSKENSLLKITGPVYILTVESQTKDHMEGTWQKTDDPTAGGTFWICSNC